MKILYWLHPFGWIGIERHPSHRLIVQDSAFDLHGVRTDIVTSHLMLLVPVGLYILGGHTLDRIWESNGTWRHLTLRLLCARIGWGVHPFRSSS